MMLPFVRVTGIAAPIEGRNIDTDQIIPGRFLKTDRKNGYQHVLFHDLRFDKTGQERPNFVLNQSSFDGACFLIVDVNFGCGSSREGAVYALADFGIRAVIAPSFGEIFYNNCLKNGIVPVCLEASIVADARAWISDGKDPVMTVDLQQQVVTMPDGRKHSFSIDPFRRDCILKGMDELQLTLSLDEQIGQFEEKYFAEKPWARAPVPISSLP